MAHLSSPHLPHPQTKLLNLFSAKEIEEKRRRQTVRQSLKKKKNWRPQRM